MAPKRQQRSHVAQRTAPDPDLYAELGLAPNASVEDIKRAYRRLALQCHPDKCPGDQSAHERFQSISLAYSVLSDEQKRRYYDQTGTTEGLDISPDEFMDMFQSLLLEIIGGADMIRDMLSCFTSRELARLPPFPFPKELFPTGTFPPGLRFSSRGLKGMPPQVEELINNGDLAAMLAAMASPQPRHTHHHGRRPGPGGPRTSATTTRRQATTGAATQSDGGAGAGAGAGRHDDDDDDDDDDEYGSSSDGSSEWTDVSEGELEELLSPGAPKDSYSNNPSHHVPPTSAPSTSTQGSFQPHRKQAQPQTVSEQSPSAPPPTPAAPSPPPQSQPPQLSSRGAHQDSSGVRSHPKTPSSQPLPKVPLTNRGPPAPPPPPIAAPCPRPPHPSTRFDPVSFRPGMEPTRPAAGALVPDVALVRAWISAARCCDVGAMAVLLERQPGLLGSRGAGLGHTALHWCAAKGSVEGVTWLLAQGQDINVRNDDGATPLHAAARNGQLEAVEALLGWRPRRASMLDMLNSGPSGASNAPPNLGSPASVQRTWGAARCDMTAVDGEGRTALQLALQYNHLQVAERLQRAVAAAAELQQVMAQEGAAAGVPGEGEVEEGMEVTAARGWRVEARCEGEEQVLNGGNGLGPGTAGSGSVESARAVAAAAQVPGAPQEVGGLTGTQSAHHDCPLPRLDQAGAVGARAVTSWQQHPRRGGVGADDAQSSGMEAAATPGGDVLRGQGQSQDKHGRVSGRELPAQRSSSCCGSGDLSAAVSTAPSSVPCMVDEQPLQPQHLDLQQQGEQHQVHETSSTDAVEAIGGFQPLGDGEKKDSETAREHLGSPAAAGGVSSGGGGGGGTGEMLSAGSRAATWDGRSGVQEDGVRRSGVDEESRPPRTGSSAPQEQPLPAPLPQQPQPPSLSSQGPQPNLDPVRRSGYTAAERAARRAALLAADEAAEAAAERREAAKVAAAEAAALAAGLSSRSEGRMWLEAARGGDLGTLKRMLEANPRLVVYQGQGTSFAFTSHTALHWAAARGHTAVVRWLLTQGANPDAPNAAGATPLHAAASHGAKEVARVLVLEAGARMGVPDALGETPRDILLRRDAGDGDSGGGGGGGGNSGSGGLRLANELELLGRLAALRDAAGCVAEWSPRAMRSLLAAAGVNIAGLLERRELVDACRELIAKYPPRITILTSARATATQTTSCAAATSPSQSTIKTITPAPTTILAPSSSSTANQQPKTTSPPPPPQPETSTAAASRPPAAAAAGTAAAGSADTAASRAAEAAVSAAKQRGNEAFSRGDFPKAVSHYTMALRLCTTPNAVLYSNRSAAYSSMSYFGKAQADAEEAVRLDPNQPKYRCRLGVSLLGQRHWREAEAGFRSALQLDPSYAAAVQGLQDVRTAMVKATDL